MKKTWNVKTLKLGTSTVEKSLFLCAKGIGQRMDAPIWSMAVYDDNTKIVIDTGYHDVDWVTKNAEASNQDESEKIQNVLKAELNWSPEDVDLVINTHLHYDHCGNNNLFTNATFYVSEIEWEFAHNPLPSQKHIYPEFLFDNRAVNYFDWVFTKGEQAILPGIMVFPTPGHTPGHQSVLINTKEGPLCFTGDAVNLKENLYENIPPQISYSNKDAFATYDAIRERAVAFMPGHDDSLKPFMTSGFPSLID